MTPWGVPKPDVPDFHWTPEKIRVSGGWSQSLGLSVEGGLPPSADAIHADRRSASFQSRRSLGVWREATLGRQLSGRFDAVIFASNRTATSPPPRGRKPSNCQPTIRCLSASQSCLSACWLRAQVVSREILAQLSSIFHRDYDIVSVETLRSSKPPQRDTETRR